MNAIESLDGWSSGGAAVSGEMPRFDPRSYHVFEDEGGFMMFDRATGSSMRITEDVHRFLHAIEQGQTLEEAYQPFRSRFGKDTADAVYSDLAHLLNMMVDAGMFRYEPVDRAKQENMLEALWKHPPRRIQLLMAQGCNLGCRYCYAWRNGSNQKETLMSWEMAKQSIDHLVKHSRQRRDLHVTFFGGEPLLNREVVLKVVDYCKELEISTPKRFAFEIITNGTLLDEETVEYFIRHRFLLMISMDGWEEMHNHNRPSLDGSNHYHHILSIARYADRRYKEEGLPAVKIRANLTNKFHDSRKVVDYLARQGFGKIGIAVIEPLPSGIKSPGAVSEDQVDGIHAAQQEEVEQILESLKQRKAIGFVERRAILPYLSPPKPRAQRGITCGVGRNTSIVDNKGDIFPCHRYEGMSAYVIGNVRTGMDRERTMGYYRKVNGNAMARCHSCWIRDYCSGGCAWLLSKENGEIADPTERECDRRRKSMEHFLSIRARLRESRPDLFNEELGNIALPGESGCGGGDCGSCSSCD